MSKRRRKPSKKARFALGLPSSSEDEPSSPSSDGDAEPLPPTTQPPPSSQAASSSMPSDSQANDKRSRFDLRYKTATQTDDDVLTAQVKTWTSDVYKHYVMPPRLVRDGDTVRYVFVCKSHPSITVTRVRHDESTSNLIRHQDRCTPVDSKEARAIASFAQGSTYTPEKFRMKLALWVARRCRPFAIVADAELIDIFHDLNARVVVPSPKTVSRDVKEMFSMSCEEVLQVLQKYPGKVHLGVDGWTSPQVIAFLGVTVHWINDGVVISIILDFIKASKSHTGVYMAARIAELVHEYGLEKKLLGFVCDNASNNDTLVDSLQSLVPSFKGSSYRVRCFAHIINLVVKAVLSQFAQPKAKVSDNVDDDRDNDFEGGVVGDEEALEEEDDDEVDPSVEASDQAMVDEVAREVEGDLNSPELTADDEKLGRFSLYKACSILLLRTLANKIVHSPTIRGDLAQACLTCKIPPKLMCRDVSTRWNSTSMLISRALELRGALNLLVINKDHNKARGVQLQRYQLSEREWKLLEELHPLLDVFLAATKRISTNKVALLHEVIPVIDIITGALEDYIANTSLLPAVRGAAARGLKMMNKYYSKTDESVVYRVAMIMHPRYKTAYFTRQNWPLTWIDTAIELARVEWERYRPGEEASPQSSLQKSGSFSERLFGELDDTITSSTDAFDDWVTSTPLPNVKDPIQWWTAMEIAGNSLARMALDFLSIPATSTDVERAFSRGGLTVSKMRHSLSEDSTRASTVLGSWMECPIDLIPRERILVCLKEKSKRAGLSKGRELGSSNASTDTIVID